MKDFVFANASSIPGRSITPPKGFEIGYVPIATRQELETPPPAK